jgi:NitT/TauT family transport system substrate-binding protein
MKLFQLAEHNLGKMRYQPAATNARRCLMVFAATLALLAGPSRPAAADQLSISQYEQVTATLPWAVAEKKDMFAKAGLHIDKIIAGAGGGSTLRNMLASDLPYGEVAMSAALAAIRQHVPIIVVNVASDHIGEITLATLPNASIKSIADLAGHKVAYTNPKSTSDMLSRMAFAKAGLAGKVTLVAAGGFGPGLTALDAGGVDAAPLIDPVLSMEPTKYRSIFAYASLVPRISWLVGVSTTAFAQQNPDKLRKLIAVRREAVDYIYAHHEEAEEIYAEGWNAKLEDVQTFFPKYFGMTDLWSRGNFVPAGLDAMSAGLQLDGDTTAPVDWSKVVDQHYLPPDLQKPL